MSRKTASSTYPTDPRNRRSEALGKQGQISAKTAPKQKPPHWTFETVNAVTIKLTDGGGSLVPASHGQWHGYQTTRALGWLVCVDGVLWVVRIGERRSPPLRLPAAKVYAGEMLRGQRDGKPVTDPIRELNVLTARIMDAVAPTTSAGNSRPVVNLTGTPPHLVTRIVRMECGS